MKNMLPLLSLAMLLSASEAAAQNPYQTRCGSGLLPSDSQALSVPVSPLFENDSLLIIPVVFQIIHQGGPENISRGQILQALKQLNDDFNRRNGDTLDIPEVFRNIRGNANIEFRLAQKDPNGNCSTGINRVYSPLSSQYGNWTTYDDSVIWDHTRYLNIFVAKNLLPTDVGTANFLLPGLANLQPVSGTGNPNLDFISMRYDVLGFSINGLPLPSHGHILTEEAGHSLSLQHVWVEPGCGVDDGVSDTPLQDNAHYEECVSFPFVSCNNGPNGDNFQNFMDYTNCKNMFTAGQVTRMRTCLANNTWRQQLCSAQNLEFTGVLDTFAAGHCMRPPVASFGYGNYLGLYYAGKPVIFHDASDWAPNTWQWTFEGGEPEFSAASDPNVKFLGAGPHKVKLLVSNDFGTDSIEQVIFVREEMFYPENFPMETFDNTNLHPWIKKHTLPNANAWAPILLDPMNGNFSMYLDSCKQWASSFETHTFNLGDNPTPNRKLEFKVSHATSSGTPMVNSSLRIVARDPRLNDWVDYFYLDLFPANSVLLHSGLTSSMLRTAIVGANTHFVPTESQWKKVSLNIPESLTGEVVFAFHWGSFENSSSFKGLYIDSIAVKGLSSATSTISNPAGWAISPNPASGYFISSFSEMPDEATTIRVFNVSGQLMNSFTQQKRSEQYDISHLSNGLYIIVLNDQHGTSTVKLIKQQGR